MKALALVTAIALAQMASGCVANHTTIDSAKAGTGTVPKTRHRDLRPVSQRRHGLLPQLGALRLASGVKSPSNDLVLLPALAVFACSLCPRLVPNGPILS